MDLQIKDVDALQRQVMAAEKAAMAAQNLATFLTNKVCVAQQPSPRPRDHNHKAGKFLHCTLWKVVVSKGFINVLQHVWQVMKSWQPAGLDLIAPCSCSGAVRGLESS